MKSILLFLSVIGICACNQSPKEEAVDIPSAQPVPVPAPPDSITAQLYQAIIAIEKRELGEYAKTNGLAVRIIHCDTVLLNDYYLMRKDEMVKNMALSSDQEKTKRAIAYLDKQVTKPSAQKIYKVKYHLDASATKKITYNEDHTRYLKEDLSEIQIVFP